MTELASSIHNFYIQTDTEFNWGDWHSNYYIFLFHFSIMFDDNLLYPHSNVYQLIHNACMYVPDMNL